MVQIGLYHLLFGMAVVALDGFLPARHEVLGISVLWTGVVLATYSYAQISRIPFGLFSDTRPLFSRRRTSYIVVGNLIATLGFLTIPFVVSRAILLISVILFSMGLSLSGPAADALLIDLSSMQERSRAASVLHSLRIFGFALGGILGAVLHRIWGFTQLFLVFGGIMLILTIMSVLRVPDSSLTKQPVISLNGQVNVISRVVKLKKALMQKDVLLMTLFLFIFQIGLFMQNTILERFGVGELLMPEEQAGTLNATWAIATLVAVILTGFFLIKKIGRLSAAYLGFIIAACGLFVISLAETLRFLYIGAFIFGFGSGMGSIPAIALMMDICEGEIAASMIAFFGLIDALGKGTAAFLAGGGSQLLGYRAIFQIEIIFLLVALPLLRLTQTSCHRESIQESPILPAVFDV